MAEVTSIELKNPTEIIQNNYHIHFEPGVHAFPMADILFHQPTHEQVRDRFRNGDLTVHEWNPEVARRMRQYSPQILGLDSIQGDYSTSLYWPWLPGSPEDMSGREEIYLVGGDLLHFQLLGPAFSNEDDETKSWRGVLNDRGWDRVREYAVKTLGVEAIGGHLLLPISLLLLSRFVERRDRMSRRAFLRLFGGAAIALSLGSLIKKLGPIFNSYSPTPLEENPPKNIAGLTKPFTDSVWLDGRTALVIAKTMEAMKVLDLPDGAHGSVVMGFPHAYQAGELLSSKTARQEAIRKYAEQFFEDIYPTIPDSLFDLEYEDGTLKDKNDEEEKRKLMMDSLLPFFTSTIIYNIKQPESDQTDNYSEFVKTFVCPEVREAVLPLGDPDKWSLSVN